MDAAPGFIAAIGLAIAFSAGWRSTPWPWRLYYAITGLGLTAVAVVTLVVSSDLTVGAFVRGLLLGAVFVIVLAVLGKRFPILGGHPKRR
jgi:hypothetical protein